MLIDNGEGQTGYLVPAADVKALSRAIVAGLEDPEKSAAMGRNGRRRVETNYTWQRVAKETIEVYNSLQNGAQVVD